MICKNCKLVLAKNQNYCNKCGAKVIRNRLTMRNLWDDFANHFLNYDNTFLKTFIKLFTKPEEVINSYIHGTRKKYINVISYFTIAITLSGLSMFVIQKFGLDLQSMIKYPEGPSGDMQREFNNNLFSFISDYQALVMMLYIPIYALFAKVVFWNKKTFNYTELLVIFLYLQSQVSIVMALVSFICVPIGIPFEIFGVILVPVQILYFAFGLKQAYNMSVTGIIIKTLIFGAILFVILILSSIGVFVYILTTEGLDKFKPPSKETKETVSYLYQATSALANCTSYKFL